MTEQHILTTKLNNGITVLAKSTKYGICAVTYANRTQATQQAEKVIGAVVYQPRLGRVFYVAVGRV